MAEGLAGIPLDPSEMQSIRGVESTALASLEGVAKPLGALALAVIPTLETLRDFGMGALEIVVDGPEQIAGTMRLSLSDEGLATVTLRGKLGSELPTFRGVPWIANFDGTFFRQVKEGDPVMVEDGAEVKKDAMVGWCVKTKGMQWPEPAPDSGIIHFALKDGAPVKKGETIMYYIEASKQ